MKIVIPQTEDIIACAKVYISAYNAEPWNEKYDISDVERYISNYPSHKFYLKNGFQEVESVLLYKEIDM